MKDIVYNPGVGLFICSECSAAIVNTGVHTEFHERIERIAREADRGASGWNVYGGSRSG